MSWPHTASTHELLALPSQVCTLQEGNELAHGAECVGMLLTHRRGVGLDWRFTIASRATRKDGTSWVTCIQKWISFCFVAAEDQDKGAW